MSPVITYSEFKPLYSLDAHVHFNERNAAKPGREEFLKSGMFRQALLISPTYAYWAGRDEEEGFEYLRNEGLILSIDRQVSEFISKHPDRFIGLCGLNLHWDQPWGRPARK
ncbi:MAG: hypothetical protein AB7P49_04970 [Bdellovibrionales bacterium]